MLRISNMSRNNNCTSTEVTEIILSQVLSEVTENRNDSSESEMRRYAYPGTAIREHCASPWKTTLYSDLKNYFLFPMSRIQPYSSTNRSESRGPFFL